MRGIPPAARLTEVYLPMALPTISAAVLALLVQGAFDLLERAAVSKGLRA